MHKKYIDKIIMSNDTRKMEELERVLLDTILYIEEVDPKVYDKIECDLYEIAEGKMLDKEKAMIWVEQMKPRAKWTYEEIEKIKSIHPTDVPTTATFVIMNMLYSDFGDIIGEEMNEETIDKYIRATEDWYFDEDIKMNGDEKLYCYWKYIVK